MATEADMHALKAWNLLRNTDGTFSWAGLPLVAGLLGIADVDGLVTRLHAIKTYATTRKDDE